jgi:hypothetical protein
MEKLKNNIFLSLIFLLGCLFLVFISYYLLENGIKNNSNKLVEVKESLAMAEGRSRNRIDDEALFNRINKDSQKIDSLFVNLDEPISLIKSWEELAIQYNISVKIDSSPIISSEEDMWKSLGFRITASGSVSNSLKFIEKLERAPYILEIQNVSMGLTEKTNAVSSNLNGFMTDQFQFDLIIKAYSK